MRPRVSKMTRKKDRKLKSRVSGSRSAIKRTASSSEQSMVSLVSFQSSPALGYLCQNLYRRPSKLGFDAKSNADELKQLRYDPLRDPALLDHLTKPRMLRRLIRLGLVSHDGRVKTSYKMLNEYRTKFLHRFAVLLAQKKIQNEDLERAATFEQRRQLQLAILKEEYRVRAKRYKRLMAKKRKEARTARRKYRQSLKEYDEMSDDDDRRRQKRVIRKAFELHQETKEFLSTRPNRHKKDDFTEVLRKKEEFKVQVKRAPFVAQPRRDPRGNVKSKKQKRRKRKRFKITSPLEREVQLMRKLNENTTKRKKINLAKLIKRLHVQPSHKIYYSSRNHPQLEDKRPRRRKKTQTMRPQLRKDRSGQGKTSTLQNISHNFTIGDAIDDYLTRLEDEHHLDVPHKLHEAAEGSIYEANYDCDSYNVEKRHSGKIPEKVHLFTSIGRATHVVEPISVTSLSSNENGSENELDSDARFYYIPDGSTTLTSATRQNLRIAEISSPPETRTPDYDDWSSMRSMNVETQTESVVSARDVDENSYYYDQLTGAEIRASSQSIDNSGSFPAVQADSGIQTSKEIVEESSGPVCETLVEAVRSDDTQRRHQVPRRRSQDTSTSTDMSTERKSSVSDSVDVKKDDPLLRMPDIEIVRLGSQPLREVTGILSNMAESLYHIQATKKSTQSETNVLSLEESQSLTGVRRALSSLDSFLSLGTVESKPLFELSRAVSKLFKLYGMKFSRSQSTISTKNIAEANADILDSDDVQVVLDMSQQRITSDLMRVCSSTDSLSSTVAGDRLLVLLKQLESEDIHLQESDILLDLIECLIDQMEESVQHQGAKKEYMDEFEDGMEENESPPMTETFEGYGIFVMIQDTLHNIADELIRVADCIEIDSTASSVDLESQYLESGFNTVKTASVSTKPKDSTDKVRQKEASTQKPSNYQIEVPLNFQPAQNEPENGASRLLSTLPKITSVRESNFGLGVGAKPKIPSAKKVKKDLSKTTDSKPKPGLHSKKHNSDSKYKRTSGRHNHEKVDYLSSSSSSTLTVCAKNPCDTCTSSSDSRKGKFFGRKRHKQRVMTPSKVDSETDEDVLEPSRRTILCCDKSSQKPSNPNVCFDKRTSLDFYREKIPDKVISQGSNPETSSWGVDIVLSCVDEVINNMRTIVEESRALGELMDRNVKNITAGKNDGSSVSKVVNQISHKCSKNLKETSSSREKTERVKSMEEIEPHRDSRKIQSMQHVEEISRILSLLIGKVIQGFFHQLNKEAEKETGKKHVIPGQLGLETEKRSNFMESIQHGIAKKDRVSSTSKLERKSDTKSTEIPSMENVERKQSFTSPLIAQMVPNMSPKNTQSFENRSETIPREKISVERSTKDRNRGLLSDVTPDQSSVNSLHSSESKPQKTQTSSKSFLNTGIEPFFFELIDSWRKISEKYHPEVISEMESLCTQKKDEKYVARVDDEITACDKEYTNTNSERSENSEMSSQDDPRMIVSEALEQVIADVIARTAQEERVLKAAGHSQSVFDDHTEAVVQIFSDALCQQKRHSNKTMDQPTEIQTSQVFLQEESRLRVTKDEPENEQTPITPITSDVLQSFVTSLLQHIVNQHNNADTTYHRGETNARKQQHASEVAVGRQYSPIAQSNKSHGPQSSTSVTIEALISNMLKNHSVEQCPQSEPTAKSIQVLASEFPEQHVSQAKSIESQKSTSSQSIVCEDALKEICSNTLKSLSSEIIQQVVAEILVSAANNRSKCNENLRAQATPVQKQTNFRSHSIVTSSFSDIIQSVIEDLLKYKPISDREQVSNFKCNEAVQERKKGTSERETNMEQAKNDTRLTQKRSDQIIQEGEPLGSQLLNAVDQKQHEQELNTSSLLKSQSSEVIESLLKTVLNKILVGSGGSVNFARMKPTEMQNMDEEREFRNEPLVAETVSSTVQLSPAQSKTRRFDENNGSSELSCKPGEKEKEGTCKVENSNLKNIKSHSSCFLTEVICDILNLAKNNAQTFAKTKTDLVQKKSEEIIHQDKPLESQLLKPDDQIKPEKELASNFLKSQSSVVIESLVDTVLQNILVGNDGRLNSAHMESTKKENLDEERGFEEEPLVAETVSRCKARRFNGNNVNSELSCDPGEKEEEKMEDSNVTPHSSTIISRLINDILNLTKSDVKSLPNFGRDVPVTLCDRTGLADHREDDDDEGFKHAFSEIIYNVLQKIVESTRLHQTDTNCNLQNHSETIELEHIVPNVSTSLVNTEEKPDITSSFHRLFSALRSASVKEPYSADDIRTVRSPPTNTIKDFSNGVLIGQYKATSSTDNGATSGTSRTNSLSSCVIQKIIEEVLYQCTESEPAKPVDTLHQERVEAPRSLSDQSSEEEWTCLRNLLIHSVSSSLIEKVILDVLITVAEQNKHKGSAGNIPETNYFCPATRSESLSSVTSFDALSKVILDILKSVTNRDRNSHGNKSDM